MFHYFVDTLITGRLRVELQLELLLDDTGQETANGMLLPARRLHDCTDGCTLGLPKHTKDFLLLRGPLGRSWSRILFICLPGRSRFCLLFAGGHQALLSHSAASCAATDASPA